ncbi:hypothetical protein FN846DRAFT_911188 [Sphaerosporella brunnea]|uniref:Uncharacterized protein n=1 Tax=Sphaerosporella brunnea TaxID=1250544 RepID=A0A5J5EMI1_9PEZI|nr:hypothetical protein FN846DRAFT_911188 [Sphaerosporella brunnea]
MPSTRKRPPRPYVPKLPGYRIGAGKAPRSRAVKNNGETMPAASVPPPLPLPHRRYPAPSPRRVATPQSHSTAPASSVPQEGPPPPPPPQQRFGGPTGILRNPFAHSQGVEYPQRIRLITRHSVTAAATPAVFPSSPSSSSCSSSSEDDDEEEDEDEDDGDETETDTDRPSAPAHRYHTPAPSMTASQDLAPLFFPPTPPLPPEVPAGRLASPTPLDLSETDVAGQQLRGVQSEIALRQARIVQMKAQEKKLNARIEKVLQGGIEECKKRRAEAGRRVRRGLLGQVDSWNREFEASLEAAMRFEMAWKAADGEEDGE